MKTIKIVILVDITLIEVIISAAELDIYIVQTATSSPTTQTNIEITTSEERKL